MADYAGIRDAIAAQIRTQVSGSNVVTEQALMMDRGPKVFVYLNSRDAPQNRQSLNDGRKTRFLCQYSIWVYAYGYKIADAMSARDALLGDVELALMADVTFGRTDVLFSYQDGGGFDHSRQDAGFNVGTEIRLIVDTKADLDTVVTPTGDFILLENGSFLLNEDGTFLSQE